MTITTLSSREFNQRISEAKKAANTGPVFITNRGKPEHVLLNVKDYKQLTGCHQKIADLLAMPDVDGVTLDFPQLRDPARPADLT